MRDVRASWILIRSAAALRCSVWTSTDDFERVELPERHSSDVREIRVVVVRVVEEFRRGENAREQQSVHVEAVDDERLHLALHQLVDVQHALQQHLARKITRCA